MSNIKNLVFDFDGVLARSIHDEINAFRNHMGIDGEDAEIVTKIRQYFSRQRNARQNNLTAQDKKDKVAWIQAYGEFVSNQDNEVFYDFLEIINNLDIDHQGIVSTNSEYCIPKVLGSYSKLFEPIYGIETGVIKAEKLEKLAKLWDVPLTSLIYITDTVADVLEIKEVIGLGNIYGCAWGWSGLEDLQTVLPPGQILHTYSDILKTQ